MIKKLSSLLHVTVKSESEGPIQKIQKVLPTAIPPLLP